MQWISLRDQEPPCEDILCYSDGIIFVCEWVESKWGHGHKSADDCHRGLFWTHWLPLPPKPLPELVND